MRRTTTGGHSTVDKSFAGGDRYVGQWKEGLVSQIQHCCHDTAELHILHGDSVVCCSLKERASMCGQIKAHMKGAGRYSTILHSKHRHIKSSPEDCKVKHTVGLCHLLAADLEQLLQSIPALAGPSHHMQIDHVC